MARTTALGTFVISCWGRGLVNRDVEAMLVAVFGTKASISRTTVSRIGQRLRAECERRRRRDLFGPGNRLPLPRRILLHDAADGHGRADARRVGHRHDAKPVLLGLGPGATESADACCSFLLARTERGMTAPLRVIADGGKGLWAAIERCLPNSRHQRCTIHLARNLVATVPAYAHNDVKGDYWAIP